MQKRALLTILILSFNLALTVTCWAGVTEKLLYAFTGGTAGASPSSSLVMDGNGNLYGTTAYGGDLNRCFDVRGCGVVFKLALVGGTWQESVLYSFQGGSDGRDPIGNLVFDGFGNLYGTTFYGGTGACVSMGCGTVFKLSPTQNGSWTESVLYSFQNQPDGAFPTGLTFDAAGNLYGVATAAGSNSRGNVYELSPPKQGNGPWSETILFNFSDFEIQANPVLVFDGKGNLYGTYQQEFGCYVACGAVYELSNTGGTWTKTDLIDFLGGGNGGEPLAGVVFDKDGNLYGTGSLGGNNWGIAFQLRPSGGKWNELMVHNFCSLNNCLDGSTPRAALVIDADGALYGTATGGGTGCRSCGVVFKLVHSRIGWEEIVLYNFRGEFEGGTPIQALILDKQGNLYGTTPGSGKLSFGTVFEVSPGK